MRETDRKTVQEQDKEIKKLSYSKDLDTEK